MDDAARDELARLRARAYGPDADIDGDLDALARLRELEAAARAADRPSDVPADESLAQRSRGAERGGRQDAAEGAGASDRWAVLLGTDDSGTPPSPSTPVEAPVASAPPAWTPPRIGRTLLIGWAASIALVAVLVGALVYGLASIRPVSTDVGARQVASLETRATEVETSESTAFLNEALALFRYEGLVVAVLDKGVLDTDRLCILVAPQSGLVGNDGVGFASGCTAGAFRATATVVVGDKSPAELRGVFVDGTELQFVWDGAVIGVFAADPRRSADTPARPSVFPLDLARIDVGS